MIGGVGRLAVGIALECELLDQTGIGERHEPQILLCRAKGILFSGGRRVAGTGDIRGRAIGIFGAIDRLLMREALKLQLLDQPVFGKGHRFQIGLCGQERLLVPVGIAVVGGVGGFTVGVAFEFQLVDQSGV